MEITGNNFSNCWCFQNVTGGAGFSSWLSLMLVMMARGLFGPGGVSSSGYCTRAVARGAGGYMEMGNRLLMIISPPMDA